MQTFARRTKEFHTFHYGTITSDVTYIKISSKRLNAFLSFFFLSQTFHKNKYLKDFFRVVATSKDRNGVEFIANMEGIRAVMSVNWF